MNPDNLIKMANQIGAFFGAMPNHEQATRDVAKHILATWEPRMIRALQERIESKGDVGLSDIVREAFALHLRRPHEVS